MCPTRQSRKVEENRTFVKMKVGEDEYLVDVEKIPYFESFLRFQLHSGQNTTLSPVHDDIPFFDIINHCVQKGYRHFFRRMPHQLSDYHILCETLEFLAIDVLQKRNLRDIFNDMKAGKSDWDPEKRQEVKGVRSMARDAAFRLLYLFVLGEFESDVRDSNMAYNAVLFVVSHRGIFKYRARKMVREAFEERFVVSDKQRKGLDKWPINEPQGEGWRKEDTTTEDDILDFDSDWSV